MSQTSVNFFASEDRAKRSTALLVFLYLLSIIAVIICTTLVCATAIVGYLGDRSGTFGVEFTQSLPWVALVITAVIFVASASKARDLREDQWAISTMLGGRFLDSRTQSPEEQRLKNIVDEMALAAGVSTPVVCILDKERRINAFATGTTNGNALIGVTGGCLTELNRDELQGIVAHEFSHILNNDTRLNDLAYSMIFGLMAVYAIGRVCASSGLFNVGVGSPENKWASFDDDGFGASDSRRGCSPVFFMFGLSLMAIGWIGSLVGRIVRAAIVRQREYLADAAAVQYTRNSEGVAGALYKMGVNGSHLSLTAGDEIEHFLFGAGATSAWSILGITVTHPKTSARIKAICPGFQPSAQRKPLKLTDIDEKPAPLGTDPNEPPLYTQPVSIYDVLPMAGAASTSARNVMPASSSEPVSQIDFGSSRDAKLPAPDPILEASVPANVRRDANDLAKAVAVCYAAAICHFPIDHWVAPASAPERQAVTKDVVAYAGVIKPLDAMHRLCIVDLCLPSLQMVSDESRNALVSGIRSLIDDDSKIDVVVLAMFRRLVRYLSNDVQDGPEAKNWAEGAHHVAVLLSAIALFLHGPGRLADDAYQRGALAMKTLGALPPMVPPASCTPASLKHALSVVAVAAETTRTALVDAAGRVLGSESAPDKRARVVFTMVCDAAMLDPAESWL